MIKNNETFGGNKYTVNDYIKKVLNGNYEDNLKYLCCALYEYHKAALKLANTK